MYNICPDLELCINLNKFKNYFQHIFNVFFLHVQQISKFIYFGTVCRKWRKLSLELWRCQTTMNLQNAFCIWEGRRKLISDIFLNFNFFVLYFFNLVFYFFASSCGLLEKFSVIKIIS